MNPYEVLDRYWSMEDTEKVFVIMAFAHDEVWKKIIEPAIGGPPLHLDPDRADHPISGPIPDKIIRSIFNARLLLVDLSPQPLEIVLKGENPLASKNIYNWNVAYELGIAQTVRQKEEIILVSQTREGIPFDISQWTIHEYDPRNIEKSKEQIKDLLEKARETVDDRRSWLVQRTSNHVDLYCSAIMKALGDKAPTDATFPIDIQDIIARNPGKPLTDALLGLAIHKLLELDLMKFEINIQSNKYWYKWTRKGKAVLKYLQIIG